MDTDLKTLYISLFNDYLLFDYVRIFQVFNLAIKLQKTELYGTIMSLACLTSFVFWFTDWFYASPYDSSRVVWQWSRIQCVYLLVLIAEGILVLLK